MQIWENWSPEDDVVPGADDDEAGEPSSSSGQGERIPAIATEVVSGNEFFLQVSLSRGSGFFDLPPLRSVEPLQFGSLRF